MEAAVAADLVSPWRMNPVRGEGEGEGRCQEEEQHWILGPAVPTLMNARNGGEYSALGIHLICNQELSVFCSLKKYLKNIQRGCWSRANIHAWILPNLCCCRSDANVGKKVPRMLHS